MDLALFSKQIKQFLRDVPLPDLPFSSKYWKWVRLGILGSIDILTIAFAYYLSFVLRLETFTLDEYWPTFVKTFPIIAVMVLISFLLTGVYRVVWRFANYLSAVLIVRSLILAIAASTTTIYLSGISPYPPRSIPVLFGILFLFLTLGQKFSWRLWIVFRTMLEGEKRERCFIYGAGVAGEQLARHITNNPSFPYFVVGYIDDDPNKKNRFIHGLKILGGGADLKKLSSDQNVSTVLIAMHAASGKIIREVVKKCHSAQLQPLIMPNISTSLSTEVIAPRPIDEKDLLKRAPKSIDHDKLIKFFDEKVVLVTGAGGSIGSEICRQVLLAKPKMLILFDSSEYNLYKIDIELQENGLNNNRTKIISYLGSVTDKVAIEQVFALYHPHIVLHAAAYKHVPIIEHNPCAGILNNVLGTKLLAEISSTNGVENFLLISTDKAVNPANVMGASKRCCELIVQAMHQLHYKSCTFSSVRFGNVLGSSGSVIPRFMEQIRIGGPVTVTHKDITRFFMLTSEAVGLVLQSLTMAHGGETFILNMGDPVKIYEMAEQLIRLAGKEPGIDIDIVVTGLRPGEKLYEELILTGNESHTLHDDIFIAIPENFDVDSIMLIINRMIEYAFKRDEINSKVLLRELTHFGLASSGESTIENEVGNLH